MLPVFLDIITVLIIVISAFLGRKRGFIRTVFNLFGTLVAYLTASILSKPIGAWIAKVFIAPSFGMMIAEKKAPQYAEYSLEMLASYVSAPIGMMIAFVLLFVGVYVLLRLAVRFFDLVAKLPILNFSNRTLGLVAGLLWGLVLAVLFSFSVRFFFYAFPGAVADAYDVIERTYLIRFFSGLDILGYFLYEGLYYETNVV